MPAPPRPRTGRVYTLKIFNTTNKSRQFEIDISSHPSSNSTAGQQHRNSSTDSIHLSSSGGHSHIKRFTVDAHSVEGIVFSVPSAAVAHGERRGLRRDSAGGDIEGGGMSSAGNYGGGEHSRGRRDQVGAAGAYLADQPEDQYQSHLSSRHNYENNPPAGGGGYPIKDVTSDPSSSTTAAMNTGYLPLASKPGSNKVDALLTYSKEDTPGSSGRFDREHYEESGPHSAGAATIEGLQALIESLVRKVNDLSVDVKDVKSDVKEIRGVVVGGKGGSRRHGDAEEGGYQHENRENRQRKHDFDVGDRQTSDINAARVDGQVGGQSQSGEHRRKERNRDQDGYAGGSGRQNFDQSFGDVDGYDDDPRSRARRSPRCVNGAGCSII